MIIWFGSDPRPLLLLYDGCSSIMMRYSLLI